MIKDILKSIYQEILLITYSAVARIEDFIRWLTEKIVLSKFSLHRKINSLNKE